jgi:hypothetical protein
MIATGNYCMVQVRIFQEQYIAAKACAMAYPKRDKKVVSWGQRSVL